MPHDRSPYGRPFRPKSALKSALARAGNAARWPSGLRALGRVDSQVMAASHPCSETAPLSLFLLQASSWRLVLMVFTEHPQFCITKFPDPGALPLGPLPLGTAALPRR
jgi:hypothetical protein